MVLDKGGNLFSFFAKKKEPQVAVEVKTAEPVALPAVKLGTAAIVPENFSKPSALAGKKRVTQRLSVQVVRAFQVANSDLAGVRDDANGEVPETSGQQVMIDLPTEVWLRALPDHALAAPREVLLGQLQPESKVSLPLASILPMLPSGRVEFGLQEAAAFLPGHFLLAPESLNGATFSLPLFEVASRIPQDALQLRQDQRPIDAVALRMDDPFNPEKMRDANDEVVSSEMVEEKTEAPTPAQAMIPECVEEAPPIEPELKTAEVAAPIEAEENVAEPAPAVAEPDLSFAQTEQFRKFLADLETEIAAKNKSPHVTPEKIETTAELPPSADILVEAREEPAPLPPDVLLFKAETSPLASFSETETDVRTEPALSLMTNPSGNVVNLSPRVNDILGLPAEYDLTLKDVVAQVRRWPGVKGCAIVDKGGLPIAFDMNDSEFAKTLSAFAPKILSRVNELFADIGLQVEPELQVPSGEFSTYICRHGEVYFVLQYGAAGMPVGYSEVIRQILAELSFVANEV